MSGGGIGLMSGGGLSMGSGGRGKSGLDGCSIMHGRPLQLHVQPNRPHERERIAVLDHARTHTVIENHRSALEPIFEVSVDRGGAQRRRQLRQRQVMRGDEADCAAGRPARERCPPRRCGDRASSCRGESRRAGRARASGRARYPRSRGSGGSRRRNVSGPACSESSMCSVAPRASEDNLRRRAVTGAPASASATLTPTERSSVLFPDMFEPLTMSTRGPAPPRATSFLVPRRRRSADGQARRLRYSAPFVGDLGKRILRAARTRKLRTTRAPRHRRSPAATPATAGPDASCHRSIAIASCSRSSRIAANGMNSGLCVESSHDTSLLRRAMRFDAASPSVSRPSRSAASLGDENGSDSMRASSAVRRPRSRSGVSIACSTLSNGASPERSPYQEQPRNEPFRRITTSRYIAYTNAIVINAPAPARREPGQRSEPPAMPPTGRADRYGRSATPAPGRRHPP